MNDRVSTFGCENYADLPTGCEAIARFANFATLATKLRVATKSANSATPPGSKPSSKPS